MREQYQINVLLMLFHYRETIRKCKANFIPENTITMNILKKDLKRLRHELSKHNLVLAIPIPEIERYYHLPITHCQVFENEIHFSIKIPMIERQQEYEVYEPIPLAYQNSNELCQLKIEKSFLLVDKISKKTHTISGNNLE